MRSKVSDRNQGMYQFPVAGLNPKSHLMQALNALSESLWDSLSDVIWLENHDPSISG
ncbi:MAG: hypothetical protein ACKO3V_04900 [Pirellula sp.]